MLRPYQEQAVAAFLHRINDPANTERRLAIEMATGLGKTITLAKVADEYLDSFEGAGNRVLVLVHTDELVRQAVDKIRLVTRGRWTIGVVKASQDETGADIVVASVQTLASAERRNRITNVGLVIVDECHHATAPTYRAILEHYGAITPDQCPEHGEYCACIPQPSTPTLGVTATLARSDGQGLGQVWQDLIFSRSMPWAIRKGYLVDLVPYTIRVPDIDASAPDAALDAMLAESIAPSAVVKAWQEHTFALGAHPSTVLFAPLVRSARAFAEAFAEAGIKAEVVHGEMPTAERRAILQRYEDGVTTVLCNAMMLTEGWDSPRTSCVIVARPTKRVPLFVQMVGRGMRPWLTAEAPPREVQRCVLLCVADTTTELATVADLSDKPITAQDGKSLTVMEDEWDIGRELDELERERAYAGPVRVEQWDAIVARSSKAWKYTRTGVPFLPTAKRGEGYVFVVQVGERADVFFYSTFSGRVGARRVASAPDLELAMALAEDEAQERGGDLGSLLADKGRAWRRQVPSMPAVQMALRVGVSQAEVERILASRTAGKAGKLSDLTETVIASRALDPVAEKIRQRGSGQ
jgi:superfamily II DNA or RNA helicase